MKAAMSCKMGTKKLWKTASETTESNKTKHASIVDTHEYARKRLGSTLPRDHEDPIAKKGSNSISQKNHKFIPMRQAMEFLDATAAVDKIIEEARKDAMPA